MGAPEVLKMVTLIEEIKLLIRVYVPALIVGVLVFLSYSLLTFIFDSIR